MDILSHTITGIAVGAGVGNFVKPPASRGVFILICALGGAFPDIDAISLWSKFDSTLGSWLHLTHTGEQIYCGKFWYSHHGFFHSLLAMALFGSLFCWIPFLKNKIAKKKVVLKVHTMWALTFFLAGTFHLLEDMPTPDNIWGGVRLFFPFEVYIGGWNYIWWWNNYDLFLIILLTATLAIILLYIPHSFRFKKITTSGILCIGIGMYCFQVHQRPVFIFDSTSSQYPKNEANSLLVQQSLLPPYLYQTMKKLDEHLPLYF